MRTEIDNWKRAVVFVEGACVDGSPRVVWGVANPIITRLSRFSTKLRLSVLTVKFVKDLVNQGREPFVGFSPVTFQLFTTHHNHRIDGSRRSTLDRILHGKRHCRFGNGWSCWGQRFCESAHLPVLYSIRHGSLSVPRCCSRSYHTRNCYSRSS